MYASHSPFGPSSSKIQYTSRTSISIRTFKARAKILSMYQYTYIGRDNEDIAYLLLEDKGSDVKSQVGDADIEIVDMTDENEEGPERKKRKDTPYQTIAVKPSGAVVPMLQNLLNPFVMGISKSARAVCPLLSLLRIIQ
jgi:hypothetical protein